LKAADRQKLAYFVKCLDIGNWIEVWTYQWDFDPQIPRLKEMKITRKVNEFTSFSPAPLINLFNAG